MAFDLFRQDRRIPARFLTLLIWLLGAAALIAVAAAALSCGGGQGYGETAGGSGTDGLNDGDTASAANPFGVYSPGNLDEVPVPAKTAMMEALGVASYDKFQDTVLDRVAEMDPGWARVDFWYDGTSFHDQPEYAAKVRDSGMEVVGNTRFLYRQIPADRTTLDKALRDLIRRYPWIEIWQIGNEPNIYLDDPQQYPAFFISGSRIVREECPDCRIMLAGVASKYPDDPEALQIYDRMLTEILANYPVDPPFDIFDIHIYGTAGSEQPVLDAIAAYRRLLEKHGLAQKTTLWLSETATYTGAINWPGFPAQTEEQQASELVRRFVSGLAAGLERVSWARPYENYGYGKLEDGYYDNSALIYNGLGQESRRGVAAGTPKLSFLAYRTLVSKVTGFESVHRLAEGAYEFRFGDERPRVCVLWGASTQPGSILPLEENARFTVTDMTGNSQEMEVPEITLAAAPIFVEQMEGE